MPDIAPNKYLLKGVNKNMIINPYRFSSGGGGGGSSTLLNGLLNWWDLNESSGNAIDATGNQDLTQGGTIGVASGDAPDGGNARDFPGSAGAYFSASAGSIWNSGSATTFACWFKMDSPGGNQGLYGHNAPNGYSTTLHIGSSGAINVYFDSGLMSAAAGSFSLNNWFCYVVTSTGPGGNDQLFINNVSKATGSNGWEPGSAIFYLGAYYNGALNWNGKICSAAIWDRVLTSDEIAEFYNSGVNLRYADLGA